MHLLSCGSKPVHNTLPCGVAFQVEDGFRKSLHHEVAGLDTMKTAGFNLKCIGGIIIIIVIIIIMMIMIMMMMMIIIIVMIII